MDLKTAIKNALSDIKVELMDEFDRNFERKGFFASAWQRAKAPNSRGSLLMRSGTLRRSLRATVSNLSIVFSSSVPYAEIHNEGGNITVTEKMKKYFWARYYELSGKVKTTKSGKKSTSKTSQRYSFEAEYFKALALMPVGKTIHIPKRQFIGSHPEQEKLITDILSRNLDEFFKYYFDNLTSKK